MVGEKGEETKEQRVMRRGSISDLELRTPPPPPYGARGFDLHKPAFVLSSEEERENQGESEANGEPRWVHGHVNIRKKGPKTLSGKGREREAQAQTHTHT